jgi:hypothetical protein
MWRLLVGALIAVTIWWLFLRRKSGYKPPVYTDTMNVEDISNEFNRAAGEMTAEQTLKKNMPDANSDQVEAETQAEFSKLNKEFEAQKAKITKPAEPLTEQSAAPAPPQTPSPVVNVMPEPETSEVQVVSPPAQV